MSYNLSVQRNVFSIHHEKVRRIIWRGIKRRHAIRGIDLPRSAMEDLVDDALARCWVIFQQIAHRHPAPLPALLHAARIAAKRVSSRRMSCLGSERTQGQTDALDHKQAAPQDLDQMPGKHYVSAEAAEQATLDLSVLPERLRMTADCAAAGVTQEVSAELQGVSDRTIRNHLKEIRSIIGQRLLYGTLCDAVSSAFSA